MAESAEGEVRYLLSDGLGSVRQVVDDSGAVVGYNEFDPYGNPVNNTKGGEPYGYTGEWYEGYTELLHLRARWYNVETGTFLSRDAVESEPAYQYVRGNPINYFDPTGMNPPPCTGDPTQICITQPVGSSTKQYPPQPSLPPAPPPSPPTITAMPQECNHFQARGYVEGRGISTTSMFTVKTLQGKEVVYDFATMERGIYDYTLGEAFNTSNFPIVTTSNLSISYVEAAYNEYFVQLQGFDSNKNLDREYSGRAVSFSIGSGFSKVAFSLGGGLVDTDSSELWGDGHYIAGSIGVSPIPIPVSISNVAGNYTLREIHRYGSTSIGEQQIRQMQDDIRSGKDSPWLVGVKLSLYTVDHTYSYYYSRIRAIKELEEVWQMHKDYFMFHYAPGF